MDGSTKKAGGVLGSLLNRRAGDPDVADVPQREPALPEGWPRKLPFRKRPKPYSRAVRWSPAPDRPSLALQPPPNDPSSPYELFVAQGVLQEVRQHLISASTNEPFGFLIGQVAYCPWAETPYVLIDAVRRETQSLPPSTEVDRFRHAWIGATRDARHRRAQLIGWYHRHGVLGLRMSEWDLKLQDEFFPEPWQCALIIAAADGPVGGFIQRSHRARLFRKGLAPFYELIDLDAKPVEGLSASVVDWGNYEPHRAVHVIEAPWPELERRARNWAPSSHGSEGVVPLAGTAEAAEILEFPPPAEETRDLVEPEPEPTSQEELPLERGEAAGRRGDRDPAPVETPDPVDAMEPVVDPPGEAKVDWAAEREIVPEPPVEVVSEPYAEVAAEPAPPTESEPPDPPDASAPDSVRAPDREAIPSLEDVMAVPLEPVPTRKTAAPAIEPPAGPPAPDPKPEPIAPAAGRPPPSEPPRDGFEDGIPVFLVHDESWRPPRNLVRAAAAAVILLAVAVAVTALLTSRSGADTPVRPTARAPNTFRQPAEFTRLSGEFRSSLQDYRSVYLDFTRNPESCAVLSQEMARVAGTHGALLAYVTDRPSLLSSFGTLDAEYEAAVASFAETSCSPVPAVPDADENSTASPPPNTEVPDPTPPSGPPSASD